MCFDFADTINKIQDISKCPLDLCDIESFADELYIHVHSERWSFSYYEKNFSEKKNNNKNWKKFTGVLNVWNTKET